jgi:enamine deaminase RidA (YjgF/YER057c/UK114 family)
MKTPKTPSRRDVALGLAALGTVPASAAEVSTRRVNPPGLLTPRGYTHVVSASGGRTVYVSGQVSANAKGEVVGKGDIKAQTTQVFENLKIALAAAGAAPKDVVKTNIYVVNFKAEDIPAIRDIRNAFFANVEPPASTLVGVTALANPDWLIEIEVIAVVA